MKGAKIAAVLVALCLCHGAWAQERQFDLAAMDAVHGIPEFARQAGIQIVAPADDLGSIKTPAIHGNLDVRVALKKLLVGTDLEIASDDGAVITLRRRANASKQYGNPARASAQQSTNAVRQGGPTVGDSTGLANQQGLSEIIVTAQKREERLEDVPVPISVLQADDLVTNNFNRLRDYFSTVPGIDIVPNFSEGQQVVIRGITADSFSAPTVGLTIDDVSFGGSTGFSGNSIPDVDPVDLARVEVLRGPQGTLYGANSMGGLVKYVTIDPSTTDFSGTLQGGVSSVYNGAQTGYNLHGAVNVPLADTLGLRLSAFSRQDPGYIDDPAVNLHGVNVEEVSGARLAALWKPTSDLSVKLSAVYQERQADGFNEADIRFGSTSLDQDYINGTGRSHTILQAYSATINDNIGNGTLTSLTGYNSFRFKAPSDATGFLGVDSLLNDDMRSFKFSQEFRWSMQLGSHVDWLAGLFYTHETGSEPYAYVTADKLTGNTTGDILHSVGGDGLYKEYAGFTNINYHVTDKLNIEVGLRDSESQSDTTQHENVGPLRPHPKITPATSSTANSVTYLVTPSYRLTPDLMAYARFASGYRPGGANNNCVSNPIPCQYQPDKTFNYEIGLKGDFFDRLLTVDASIYYIDWKDIQFQLDYNGGPAPVGYTTNGGAAKSEGVELSATVRPVRGLTLSGWVSIDDAVLTSDFPANSPLYGAKGDRLPSSSRFSGHFSIEQEFPLWQTRGFIGGDVSYLGDRRDQFQGLEADGITPLPRLTFGAYAKTNVHFRVQRDNWSANLYVNNVADKRGILEGDLGNGLWPYAYVYIVPRTMGLNITRSF